MTRRRSEAGFTLVEVAVAVAILAAAVVILYSASAQAGLNAVEARDTRLAWYLCAKVMSEALLREGLDEFSEGPVRFDEERFEAFVYEASARRVEVVVDPANAEKPPREILRVEVKVRVDAEDDPSALPLEYVLVTYVPAPEEKS